MKAIERRSVAGLMMLAVIMWTTCASLPAWAQAEKSAGTVQYEALSREYAQMRDTGAKRLGPQELLESAESLEGKIRTLIGSCAGDPSAKSKAQELLSYVCEFSGKAPESRAAYGDYLDTLEAWQGKDYAVMAVRRAGDRMLEETRNFAKAIEYYDQLIQKYPGHASKAQALYGSGLACIEGKEYTEAARRMDLAVAANPSGYYAPWALRKKAYALAEMVPAGGDFSASLAVLDELAAKYPTREWKAYAGYRKGFTLARGKKYLEALAEYSKGYDSDPSSAYSWMGRKHVAQIKKTMEKEILENLAREKRLREGAEPADTATAAAAGAVSMALPDGQDRLGEGRP